MVNYFIYAKDYSGSTEGVSYYHENGLKTLEQFKSDVNKIKSELPQKEESEIIYLHWDHMCEKVDEAKALQAYRKQKGSGFTNPEGIIEWVKENINRNGKIKLLYIITDGQIGKRSLDKCLELNKDIEYEKVVFHAINKYLRKIDLSVTASFITAHCTIYRNNELFDETDISTEFDYDKITAENFTTEKESLKSYIKFKFLTSTKSNATALTEIDKLKKLKIKLLNRVTGTAEENFPDITTKTTFISEFKKTIWYKSFSNPSYDLKKDIEKSVTTLINYIVSDKKSYGFDALKFETKFNNEVTEEEIADVNFTADQEIEFPDIILADEKGIPVILCTELNLLDKIIFQASETTATFSKFNSTMECPLFLLDDPDLNESIGYFYTLTVYKQLLEQPTKLEPRSRRPFHGGLVLVDTDDFDKYNDYILSATYFNFKKVKYNVGLFYFVLWKICEKKQWMDENVVAQFKKYMLRRVSTTKCKIGLSSLPLDPRVNSSLCTALWYCVEMSSYIFKDDPERFTHERLRMHYGVAHSMIEILKYLNYSLDMDAINKRRDLIRHVMILKKIPMRRDKVLYVVEKIFKNVNGFLVSEIENAANVKKLNYLKLKHKEMLRDDVITEEVNLDEYVHFLHQTDVSVVQICEKTFRPFFMIDENRSFYSELFKIAKQIVVSNVEGEIVLKYEAINQLEFSKILSFFKLYQQSVKDNNKFPTLNEYTEYILKKKKIKGNLVTIFPVNVCEEIQKVFVAYETLTKGVSVSDFVSTSNKYVNRFERVKAENKVNFESDDKIKELISEEERNVSLKKVVQENNQELLEMWGLTQDNWGLIVTDDMWV